MVDLPPMVEFVKGQAQFHKEMVAKYDGNERRQKRHAETAILFDELADYLQTERSSDERETPIRLALSWDEVEDLPPELIAELSVSDGDKTEFQILSAIEKLGGIASLDRILVELWRATGEVSKRAAITNRLYRMGGKGMLYSLPGKKGVYSLRELAEEEVAELR